jgi:diguanylate cyclase (GGDEF)-like protein
MEQAAVGLSALASLIGSLAAARRRNLRLCERVREQGRLIQAQTLTDAVTGLANRRQFCSAVEAEVLRARRYRRPLSLAVLDIRGFCRINEEFGYDTGDLVLREVGHCLSCTVRQTDLVGRIGADEFGLLLPETSRSGAMAALARVVAQVEDLNASGELPVEIKLAIGIADQTGGLDAMLSEAYRALARGLTSVG